MRIRVNVTAEDIRKGKRSNETSCPIAKAMRRAGALGPQVNPYEVRLVKRNGYSKIVGLSAECCRFIAAFDSARYVRPFAFTVNIPAEFLRHKSQGKHP